MRARMLVAVAFAAALAARCGAVPSARGEPRTEPRIEASGFVGVDWFGDRSELGNSWAPEQVPGTAPVVGARAGWLALPGLPGDLQLALEAELAFAPAFTGSRLGAGRMAYFAPVFEWRGQAVLRFARWGALVPHVVLGGGGDSVATHSPFMADDTDPIGYWGAGFTAPVRGGWQLRLDLHQGVMPSRDGGAHLTAELELGLGIAFGSPARPRPS
ncbi:MAG TPA: hypothetical protein VK601_00540, partial [Kofleriaceae bacterium]|nr:hypothetical protein [Kofleriaceae bacterium]